MQDNELAGYALVLYRKGTQLARLYSIAVSDGFRGQGIANTATGFIGGMAGCAMIGQSMINMKSGGRGRLSGITARLALLAFILFSFACIFRFISNPALAVIYGSGKVALNKNPKILTPRKS